MNCRSGPTLIVSVMFLSFRCGVRMTLASRLGVVHSLAVLSPSSHLDVHLGRRDATSHEVTVEHLSDRVTSRPLERVLEALAHDGTRPRPRRSRAPAHSDLFRV